MTDERRRFSRIPIDYRINIIFPDGKQITGIVDNISLKGILVGLDQPTTAQGQVVFEIRLVENDDSMVISGQAEIVRRPEPNQIGLKLVHTDVDSLTHLRRIVELNTGDSDQVSEEIMHWAE